MATITQASATFTFTLDAVDHSCQIFNAEFTQPGPGEGESKAVGCGTRIPKSGEWANGALTGTVFVDTSDTGLTFALSTLRATSASVPYELVFFPDLAGSEVEYSGDAQISEFVLGWDPETTPAEQEIAVVLLTGSPARPIP